MPVCRVDLPPVWAAAGGRLRRASPHRDFLRKLSPCRDILVRNGVDASNVSGWRGVREPRTRTLYIAPRFCGSTASRAWRWCWMPGACPEPAPACVSSASRLTRRSRAIGFGERHARNCCRVGQLFRATRARCTKPLAFYGTGSVAGFEAPSSRERLVRNSLAVYL